MSHGTRIRPDVAAWAVGTVVDPAEFDALDEGQFVSINGDDGGTWAPSAAISIGGAGVNLEGSSHYIEGKLSVQSGGFVTVLDGGVVKSYNDRIILNGAGTLQVGSSGLLEVLSGGGLALRAGSVTTSYGEAYFAGTTEFLSGGMVTFRGGIVDLLCGMNVGDAVTPKSGMIQFNGAAGHAGGYASFLGPDCFSFADTATGTLDGILTKRVAGRITNRIIAGADPGGGTEVYGPGDADTIIAVTLSNPRTYDLSGAALHGDRITIVNRNVTHTITVMATASAIYMPFGTVPIVLLNATGNRYAVTLEFSDGTGSRPTLGWYLVQEVRVP